MSTNMQKPKNSQAKSDRESRTRSLLKAISYRITGTTTTALLVYFISGEWKLALALVAVEPIVKIIIYYLHERLWQMLPRGSVRNWRARRSAT